MSTTLDGQVTGSAAEIYESFFVPALFQQWPPQVAKAAGLAPSQRVLDVACGTGVLAREAARQVQPDGAVTGLDRNPGMLALARRTAPGIDWREGMAEQLPFEDNAFDRVLCQFGLMFFQDRTGALKEMRRVLRPGGLVAVAVWDAIDRSPGYAAMADLLERLFGQRVAAELRAPFMLGDQAELRRLFELAGLPQPRIETCAGTARFPSIEAWVHTDIKGWTLADLIDDDQYRTLLQAALRDLRPLAGSDGRVAFAAPAHLATATRI
ncbi:methyltransferase domain-containing protein [Geminicoccus roseus]|uniref:methyltransferase domain-containing protein n=1 Tax=Geminicoccus roseus TaxID=404900 RepID=UPI000404ADA1|nr:methyltransferase domain-containing protein [Geminicoccus roseus]